MASHDTGPPAAPRRQVLRIGSAAAAAAATLAAVPPTAAETGRPGRSTPPTRVPLRRSQAVGIDAAEVSLAVRVRGGGRWTSEPMDTDEFALLGLSWAAHAPTPAIEVRVHTGGAWQGWRSLPVLDDRPDPDDEPTLRHATHPLWVGSASGVQVRVSGHRPSHVTLTLVRPLASPADGAAADPSYVGRSAPSGRRRRRRRKGGVPRPRILRRADWSANESWREGRPSYNDTIVQVHVHHTVSGNDYTRRETPGLIRGMYYYHTHTLGWSDLGYNFLVDRFGRIWEGRAGGVGKAVRGAHTLGFNATSCGVSVIGNLEQAKPSDRTIAAVARVAAWKLSRFDRDPAGTVSVRSEGSDRFPRGKRVSLPVIDGHRDTNSTACPGQHLYARLDDVRRAAAELVAEAGTPRVEITTPFSVTGDPTPASVVTVAAGTFTPPQATASYAWLRDGVPIRRATTARRRVSAADVGHLLSVVVTLSAEGLEPAVQRIDLPEVVRHIPTLGLAVMSAADWTTVDVTVTTTGVDDPGGTVVVTDGAGSWSAAVTAGRASVAFPTPSGDRTTRTIRATYSGTELVRPATVETAYEPGAGSARESRATR